MRYTLLLCVILFCSTFTWSQTSIYINRKQTCIRAATTLLNNCIIKDINKGSIKYKRIIKPINSGNKAENVNRLYYAHLNVDSSITFRRIRWKSWRFKSLTWTKSNYSYVDIKRVDFEIHKIFKKKEMKECEYCYQDKKVVYLDSAILYEPTLDNFSLSVSEYRYSLLEPKTAIIRIDSNYLSDGVKYYSDLELKNEITFNKGKHSYATAKIPVERMKNITLNKPRIYRQLPYCPDQRKMDSLEILKNSWGRVRPILVDYNLRYKDYSWKYLPFIKYSYNSIFNSGFYQIGLETQHKKQGFVYTFGMDKNQDFSNEIKYNYKILNLHANNRLLYKEYDIIETPFKPRFKEANYQMYLGNSFQVYQKELFYTPYLGFSTNLVFRAGKISFYIESGTANIFKKGTRLESRTEFGISFSLAIQYL